jgi:hypothetical protein
MATLTLAQVNEAVKMLIIGHPDSDGEAFEIENEMASELNVFAERYNVTLDDDDCRAVLEGVLSKFANPNYKIKFSPEYFEALKDALGIDWSEEITVVIVHKF